jgi:hypothetical protein
METSLNNAEDATRRLLTSGSFSWRIGEVTTVVAPGFLFLPSSSAVTLFLDSSSGLSLALREMLASEVGSPLSDVTLANVADGTAIKSSLAGWPEVSTDNTTVQGVQFVVEVQTPQSSMIITRLKLEALRNDADASKAFTGKLATKLEQCCSASVTPGSGAVFAFTSVPVKSSSSLAPATSCDSERYDNEVNKQCGSVRQACMESLAQSAVGDSRKEALCSTSSSNGCAQFFGCIELFVQAMGCNSNTTMTAPMSQIRSACKDVDAKLAGLSAQCQSELNSSC